MIPEILILVLVIFTINYQVAYGTNNDSYQYGFWEGSNSGPQNNASLNEYPTFDNNTCSLVKSTTLNIPAVTNMTACEDGWYDGYKIWCNNHAVNCVQNFTLGKFPEMVLNAHSQYLAGKQAGQKYGNNYFICPGSNQAFCKGYSESLDEITNYGGECASETSQAQTSNLIGCPFDYVQSVAGFPMLVGKWNFVNESGSAISGKIVYGANGDFNQTIPARNGLGDVVTEDSWASDGHMLREFFGYYHLNMTFTSVTPNHMELKDAKGDIILLMR